MEGNLVIDGNTNAQAQERLEFGIVTGQHRRPLSMIEEHWAYAHETGWDSAWAFDHFFELGDESEMGVTLEGWTLIAGLCVNLLSASILMRGA